MVRKHVLGLIDIFLVFLISINILDFFEIIGSNLDYVKKIISWVLLGYLLYKVSPAKLFFGEEDSDLDTLLITAFFLMVIKNLISYASIAYQSASSLLQPFYVHLIRNYAMYEQFTFITACVLLVAIGLWVAWRVPFHKRSIMGVLHEEGEPNHKKIIHRFLITEFVFFSFFLLVFNLLMEWLAIAVDATLLMIILLFYSVFIIRHKISVHKFLSSVGNAGNTFYESFIDHFRYKESFLLGVAGLIVLHLLTDIGNFIIPYIIGIHDQIYFGFLGAGHTTIWQVFALDWSLTFSVLEKISVIILYLANISMFVLLFLSPAIIWYFLYKRKRPQLPNSILVLFFSGLPVLLLSPLFIISRLSSQNLLGVDVQTSSIFSSSISPVVVASLVLLCLAVSSTAVYLSHHHRWRWHVQELWTAIASLFLSAYILLYFVDVASYYLDVIFGAFALGQFFLALLFFLFLVITILFYPGGLIIWFYELIHRTHSNTPVSIKKKH